MFGIPHTRYVSVFFGFFQPIMIVRIMQMATNICIILCKEVLCFTNKAGI